MNKAALLLSIFILLSATVSAQELNYPIIGHGDSFTIAVTDTVAPGEAGANMVWDYSGLVTIQAVNGQFFETMGSVYADDYPNSNYYQALNGGQYYYLMGPYTQEYYGGVENGASYPYDDSEHFYDYPFAFESTHSDDSYNELNIQGLATYRSIETNSACDGYGVLTLPGEGNTYDDVYRVRVNRLISDSTITGTTVIEVDQIQFLAQGLGSPLVLHTSLYIASAGGTDEYQFCEFMQQYTVGTEEIIAPSFALFPNPTSDVATIKWASTAESLEIFDASGRLVETVTPVPGLTVALVDVSSWSPGIYSVIMKNGDQIASENLVVE